MLKEAFQKLIKHSFIFGLGNVANRIIGFILIPVYTRFLLTSDYGVLAMVGMAGSIISLILNMGLSIAIFKYYFLFAEEEKKRLVVSTAFWWLLLSGIVGTGLLIAFSKSLSLVFLKTESYASYLVLVFLSTYLDLLRAIPMAVMRAKEKSLLYSLLSIANFVVGVAFNIYLVVVLRKGAWGVLEAGLITAIITTPIFILFIKEDIKRKFSRDVLKRMLKFGLPLVPAGIASFILTLSDRYFLNVYSSLSEVGLYSLGYKFGFGINILIVTPFQLIWPALLFSMAEKKEAGRFYSKILTYFLLLAGSISLMLSLFSKEVIQIMAAPAYWGAYKVISLVAFSYVLYGIYFIVAVGINLKEKTYHLPWIVGTAAGLNLFLNYLLIPTYGMMGAAWATFFSYLALVVINYFINQKYYHINYEWGRISMLIASFLAVLFIANRIMQLSFFNGILFKIILAAVYITFVFIILLDTREREVIRETLTKVRSHFI